MSAVLSEDSVILRDLEKLLKTGEANSYKIRREDISEMLSDVKKLTMKFHCSEIEFVDLRVIDDSVKRTIKDVTEHLKSMSIITENQPILREISGYFVFDENTFAGLRIKNIASYFKPEDIFFPFGKQRKKQALVRYHEKIANHIKNGRQFSFLRTVKSTKYFTPTPEEEKLFIDFIYLENIKHNRRSYFGVWE